MNKKSIFAVVGAALLAGAVVTALVLSRPNVDAYASVIPADAKAIMRIDPQQLVREADFSASDIVKLLHRVFTSDDGERTGLDLARPVFGFVGGSGDMGFVARVDDTEQLVQRLAELKAEGRATDVTSQRGLSWTLIADQWLMAFDDDKALVMGPATANDDYLRTTMTELMRQKRDDSGMTSDLYLDLNARQAPMAATVTATMLPPEMQKSIHNYLPVNDLSTMRLGAELHTQDNVLTLNLSLSSPEEDFDEVVEEIEEIFDPIDGGLIQHASESPLLWVCTGIDGEKFLKMLRHSEYARFILILLNAVADVDAIIGDIDGDVAVELLDSDIDNPKAMLTAQMDDKFKSFDDAPYWLKSAAKAGGYNLRQTSPNDFVFSSSDMELRFGTNGNTFYASSSELLTLNTDGRKSSGAIASRKNDIRGKRLYATLDIAALDLNTINTGLTAPEQIVGELQRLELIMPEVNELTLRLTAREGTNIARVLLLSDEEQ